MRWQRITPTNDVVLVHDPRISWIAEDLAVRIEANHMGRLRSRRPQRDARVRQQCDKDQWATTSRAYRGTIPVARRMYTPWARISTGTFTCARPRVAIWRSTAPCELTTSSSSAWAPRLTRHRSDAGFGNAERKASAEGSSTSFQTVQSPVTCTGTLLGVLVPSPNWPAPLAPQVQTVPSSFRAREWLHPAAMVLRPVSELTGTGTLLLAVVPFPSWPKGLYSAPR